MAMPSPMAVDPISSRASKISRSNPRFDMIRQVQHFYYSRKHSRLILAAYIVMDASCGHGVQ